MEERKGFRPVPFEDGTSPRVYMLLEYRGEIYAATDQGVYVCDPEADAPRQIKFKPTELGRPGGVEYVGGW